MPVSTNLLPSWVSCVAVPEKVLLHASLFPTASLTEVGSSPRGWKAPRYCLLNTLSAELFITSNRISTGRNPSYGLLQWQKHNGGCRLVRAYPSLTVGVTDQICDTFCLFQVPPVLKETFEAGDRVQRTWIQLSAPTWCLKIVCDSCYRGSRNLFWPLGHLSCMYVCVVHFCAFRQNIHTN